METVVSTAISSTTETVTDVLTTNLPSVMVVFAGLLALGILIRVIKYVLGRRAG